MTRGRPVPGLPAAIGLPVPRRARWGGVFARVRARAGGRGWEAPAARAGPSAGGGRGRRRRASLAVGAGAGAALLLGGVVGVVVGALTTAGTYWWSARMPSPVDRRAALEEDQLARQLPLGAELLAACLGSAASPSAAVSAVGRSLGAPIGPRLVALGGELALGAPPELCWTRLGEQHPALAPLARCLVRTSLGGVPVAGPLIGLAQAQRSAAARSARAGVRRAGVFATAPLGLCFLPAFVLIGVVPVVIGLTTRFTQGM